MKFKEPINKNYCANIVEVSKIIEFDNCDNVCGAIVSGYQVIVSKDIKEGTIGVFFPVETKLSENYLKNNNLYAHSELNIDKSKKGYFNDNGRIRCVKFRGHKSEGLFMPLESFSYLNIDINNFKVDDEFDFIDGEEICRKYIIKKEQVNLPKGHKKQNKVNRIPRLVDNQFRLHIDTGQLKKNIYKITPDTLISITSKYHGSSCVLSNILVKRKLCLVDKIAKLFGANIKETEYGYVYASRNVVKNGYFEKADGGFYNKDIWKEMNDRYKDLIPKGFSLYGEIVGYVNIDSFIQKGYHYGCENGEKEFYVYRITYTNEDGKVYELTRPEIDNFCNSFGLKTTPLYFYGYAKDVYPDIKDSEHWHENFINRLESDASFGMCDVMCKYNNKEVPSEGVVVRIENILDMQPFKLKNYKFLTRETKALDNGEIDIESEN